MVPHLNSPIWAARSLGKQTQRRPEPSTSNCSPALAKRGSRTFGTTSSGRDLLPAGVGGAIGGGAATAAAAAQSSGSSQNRHQLARRPDSWIPGSIWISFKRMSSGTRCCCSLLSTETVELEANVSRCSVDHIAQIRCRLRMLFVCRCFVHNRRCHPREVYSAFRYKLQSSFNSL